MIASSDVSLIAFPTTENSFTRAFLGFVSEYEAKEALIDPETKEMLTFWDLESLVNQMRHNLHKRDLTKRMAVATLCGNSIDYILMCLAAIDLGVIIVPINPASTLFEIEKYVSSCELEHIIIEREYENKIEALKERGNCEELSIIYLDELRGLEEGEIPLTEIESQLCGEETAFVFFSSGTTGPPKPIRHSHRTILAHLQQVMSTTIASSKYPFPNLLGGNRVHGVLPYFHAGGLITVFCMLVEGVTVVVNRKWNQQRFLRIIQDYKVTIINIVPPIMEFLVKHPSVDSFDLSTLRLVFVGAARCEENLIRALKERLPAVQDVVQLFGTTEAGMLLFATPVGNTRLSSVGRPMPGVQAVVANDEECLGRNIEGQLVVRSPTLMEGYLGKSDFHPHEWYETGDLARIDDEGFVYIAGRIKDMIKVRGWQVNPYEIEEAIKSGIPGVKDCAVAGVKYGSDGHRPKAFVVADESVDENKVIDFVRETFISYKHLCGVQFVKEIPRTSSGKIIRGKLTGEANPLL